MLAGKPVFFKGAWGRNGGTEEPVWRPVHTLCAAGLALILYGFDAIEIMLYDHARAPNVRLVSQLILLFLFYILWTVVPWCVWTVIKSRTAVAKSGLKSLIWRLAALGIVAYAVHMTVLAIVLRILYSPPGWGAYHILLSVIELWIQQAGIWWGIFAGVAVFMYFVQQRYVRQPSNNSELVYQVRHANKVIPVNIKDVCWIEAADNYVLLHTENNDYIYRKTLSALEEETRPYGLVRAHRCALVNTAFVEAVSRDKAKGDYRVEMRGGMMVPLSRRRLSTFKKHMSSL